MYAYDTEFEAFVESRDGGKTFTEQYGPLGAAIIDFDVDPANARRLVALYRALKDGTVQRSADRGKTWQASGRVGGEPYELKATGRNELYLALSDGTILHTTNGGKTWQETFRP